MQALRVIVTSGLIVTLFLIYWLVIRPRLQARFTDLYAHVGGFWARTWARIVAFQTFVLGSIGLILPEVVTLITPYMHDDLDFLPDGWKGVFRAAIILLIIWARARATTPGEEPPAPLDTGRTPDDGDCN